ncbi:hypothetical protein HN51_046879 [Arachis hypogaea]
MRCTNRTHSNRLDVRFGDNEPVNFKAAIIKLDEINTQSMQIKQASMTLAKMYMKRVTMELESNWNTDRESSQDSLLLQGVHFAYKAYQVTFDICTGIKFST